MESENRNAFNPNFAVYIAGIVVFGLGYGKAKELIGSDVIFIGIAVFYLLFLRARSPVKFKGGWVSRKYHANKKT